MLRIVFSSKDLAWTRVAPSPDPVWELVLSLHRLQDRGRDDAIGGWRRQVRDALRRDGQSAAMHLLLLLNPPRSYFPDFLTPWEGRDGLAAGLEALRATPVPRLRRDMDRLARRRPLPSSAAALARGEPEVLRQLTESMARYAEVAILPYWARLRAAVEADRARRIRALLDGGVDGLLGSLRPGARWEAGVLEIPDYPSTREVRLDGRGLLLVPSYFCDRTPVTLVDLSLPPVLVYPVDRCPVDRLGGLPPAQRHALGALLGRTRAAVLEAVGNGSSTGEIARRLGVSLAAASQHASVLRNAGLVVSRRDGNTVLHTLTPLGFDMLAVNAGRRGFD